MCSFVPLRDGFYSVHHAQIHFKKSLSLCCQTYYCVHSFLLNPKPNDEDVFWEEGLVCLEALLEP